MTLGLPPEAWAAAALSLQVSAWATALSLPFGLAAAMALARGRFWGRGALDLLVHAPLVMPPVATGYLLLLAFGPNGPLGAPLERWFGVGFAFQWTGAALAAAVMGFPLLVRAIRLSLEAVDPRMEEAAATLGAGRVARFMWVTLPLIAPGVLVGAVLCFARAMGEFGATITFVAAIPGRTETLPAAIYALTQTPGGDAAALRLTLVSIGVAVAALALSEALSRRMQRRLGRSGAKRSAHGPDAKRIQNGS